MEITYGIASVQQLPQIYALRQLVLRQPLGLNLFDENLVAEHDQITIIATYNDAIIGCVLINPLDALVFKLRQMAVHPIWQGKGIGKQLMHNAHKWIKENGGTKVTLHARLTAHVFYTSLGYVSDGAIFTEVGIPHVAMYRDLP
jgi:predicted GNAT family N-acyltransferase